jgi:hypothetical protein
MFGLPRPNWLLLHTKAASILAGGLAAQLFENWIWDRAFYGSAVQVMFRRRRSAS